MNRYSLCQSCLLAILSLLLLSSCSAPTNAPIDDVGERGYEFTIEREESENNQTLTGVKAKWSHDIGTILLGTEDEGELLAQLLIPVETSCPEK